MAIQRSQSAPDALGKAIAAASPLAKVIAARAGNAGPDGGHDHGNGGGHGHEHVMSRLTDLTGRVAELEKAGDGSG